MQEVILVVDDNEDLRETMLITLSRQGYEVWLAPDGNNAKKLLDQPELASAVCTVICDLAMANGSGMDLINYLRKDHPAIPIIVYSGTDDTVFLQGILQDGVCDWMRKPVSRDTMLQKVRTSVHLFTIRKQQDSGKEPSPMPSTTTRTVSASDIETLQEYHDRNTGR
jgi:two-component system response regulator PilR (NtrC family)